MQRKGRVTHRYIRAKENIKLSHGELKQRQASGNNQSIKALCQGTHCG